MRVAWELRNISNMHSPTFYQMKTNLFFILGIMATLCSCTSQEERCVKDFAETQELHAEAMKFDNVIKSGDIYMSDNYLILRDINPNAEYLFYVYSRPALEYLYRFAPRGNGADEYLMPTVIKNTTGNLFAFRDHATDKYSFFQLTDSAAILKSENRLENNDGRFSWEINQIGENRYLMKRNNSRHSCRELWDMTGKALLDTLPNTFNLSSEMGHNYYTEFDDYWISASGTKFASAYFFIDRIETGTVDGNTLVQKKATGVEKAPKFYLFKEGKAGSKYQYNVDNNIVRYEYLTCTPSFVFGLYAGIPWGEVDVQHSSSIEVYDWELNPVKLLKLDQNIAAFVVDEAEKTIYGINPEAYEDAILKFKYQ